jgi:Tfp pilus assembly protein PilN
MIKVNLLPPRIKAARAKRLMMTAGAAAVAAVLTIPIGFWYIRYMTVLSLRGELKVVTAETAKPEYAGVIEKVTALETQEGDVAKKLEVLDKLLGRQATWIRIMEALSFSQARAKDLWLTGLTSKTLTAAPDTGKVELTIQGMAFSAASVNDFVSTFLKSEFNPELGTQSMTIVPGEGGQRVLQFVAVLKIKV